MALARWRRVDLAGPSLPSSQPKFIGTSLRECGLPCWNLVPAALGQPGEDERWKSPFETVGKCLIPEIVPYALSKEAGLTIQMFVINLEIEQ